MKPHMETLKVMLDKMTGTPTNMSWVDKQFDGEDYQYKDKPAYRYSCIIRNSQREAKRICEEVYEELILWFDPYEFRINPHLTRSHTGQYYWKVEVVVIRDAVKLVHKALK